MSGRSLQRVQSPSERHQNLRLPPRGVLAALINAGSLVLISFFIFYEDF
jgi:hypothetical protein